MSRFICNKRLRNAFPALSRALASGAKTHTEQVKNDHDYIIGKNKAIEKLKSINAEQSKKVYTLPNILTFSRIATAPAICYFISTGAHPQALACFAYAATTDLLDGWVARKYNQYSDLGALLDPLADKLLLTTCFVTMYCTGLMPYWVIKFFVFRDLCLLVGGSVIRYTSFKEKPSLKQYFDLKKYPTVGFEPTFVSKCNTALQCSLIIVHLGTNNMVGIPIYDISVIGLQCVTILTTMWTLTQYSYRFFDSCHKIPKTRG